MTTSRPAPWSSKTNLIGSSPVSGFLGPLGIRAGAGRPAVVWLGLALLWTASGVRAMDALAPRLGVGPRTPRPKLNTLPTPPFVPGEIIVCYSPAPNRPLPAPAAPRARVARFLTQRAESRPVSRRPLLPPLHPERCRGALRAHLLACQERRERFGLRNVDVFTVPADMDVVRLSRHLTLLPEVESARPDFIFPLQLLPDDPFYSSSDSWGQGFDDLYGPKLLQCEQAWDLTQGQGVVVAVVDSGVDYTHPDLAANLWINDAEDANGNGTYEPWPATEQQDGVFGDHNDTDDDANGYVDDVIGYDFVGNGEHPDSDPRDTFGHGTHVAGTVAAVGNNGIGVIGIAPQARIMTLKISRDDSGGVSVTAATEALAYAAENGASVSNHSWGGFGDETLVPTLAAAFNMAADAGMVHVVAAGNFNADAALIVPANLESTITVAATDHNDIKADFSNFGLIVDVSAPGGGETEPEDIDRPANSVLSLAGQDTVLERFEGRVLVVGEKYLRLAGTSMASPHVAGVAALIRSFLPGDTPDDVRARLKAGADPLDLINPDFAGRLGAGRVNAPASLLATPHPLLELVATVPQGLVAPGGEFEIVVTVRNSWRPATQVQLDLASPNPLIVVDPAHATVGDMAVGDQADNGAEPFGVFVDASVSFGEILPFELTLSHADGSATAYFSIPTQLFQDVIFETGLPATGVSSITMCMEDVNTDAYPEVLHTRIFRSAEYYRNRRDGTFRPRGLPLEVVSILGLAILDVDNDLKRDLVVPGNVPDRSTTKVVFRRLQAHQFEAVPLDGDIRDSASSRVLGLDYNDDGLLDLMILGVYRVRLFRNDGNLQFTEVTDETLPEIEFGGQSFIDAVLADYDNDGLADVIATGGGGRGLLILRNQGDGTFEDATSFTGIPLIDAQDLAVGDFDNDGWVDIFAGDDPGTGPANHLLHNNADGTFSDITEESGAIYETDPQNRPAAYNGSECFDFDNDGWLDVFVQCGDNDTHPLARLYRNTGAGSFTDETATHITLPDGARFTATYDDYDNDGDVDIYLSDSLFGTAGFLRNYTTSIAEPNHWVRVRLQGTESNQGALGGRITVRTGTQQQIRDVTSANIASQPVHFGLGGHDNIDEIIIRWPDGSVQRHTDQPVDTTLFFVQGEYRKGDADGDGDLDLNDFVGFAACFGSTSDDCPGRFDFDGDGEVNLVDFATFAVAYTGSTQLLVNAGPSHTIYVNRSAQLLQPTVSGGRAPYMFRWDPPDDLSSPNSPTPVAEPLEDTVYTLTVTDVDGRVAQDSLLVRVLPMAVKVGDDVAIYGGESTPFEVPQVFGGILPYAYSWSPTEGLDQADVPAPTASPTVTTDYVLTVTDSDDPPHLAQNTIRVFVDGIYELADMGDGTRGITIIGPEDRSSFGSACAAAGDVNDDGIPDVVVGAPSADFGEDDRGAAYVIFGGNGAVGAGTVEVTDLDGALGFEIRGLADNDFLGVSAAGIGDVNGDDIADVAVGATGADGGGDGAGAVYVVFGTGDLGAAGVLDLSALNGTNGFVIHGVNEGDNLGRSISRIGDVNDDGISDFVIGAEDVVFNDAVTGAAYVIFGAASLGAGGTFDLSTLDGSNGFVLYGTNENDRVGISVADAGDVNGDMIDDLIVGADSIDRPNPDPDGEAFIDGVGGAYVLFGGSTLGAGGVVQASALNGTDGFVILGGNETEFVGSSVAGAGDFNSDGYPDVVLGAPWADFDANNTGGVYVVYGGPGVGADGVVDLMTLGAGAGFVLRGDEQAELAGYRLAGAGDVNGDNTPDMVIGVPFEDTDVFNQSTGSAYVLFGGMGTGASGSAEFGEFIGPTGFRARGVSVIDFAGVSVSGAGDFNDDGYDDVIVGADNARHEPSDTRPGVAYLIFGKPPANSGPSHARGQVEHHR